MEQPLTWWFGEPIWNSTFVREDNQVNRPTGSKCLECTKPIGERDRGMVVVCSSKNWGGWDLVLDGHLYHVCSYHLTCFLSVCENGELMGEIRMRALGAPEPVEVTEEKFATKSGRVLTDADFQALADEAERGYDPKDFEETATPGKGWNDEA